MYYVFVDEEGATNNIDQDNTTSTQAPSQSKETNKKGNALPVHN